MEQQAEAKRLEWLCRRGTRELDLLLRGYLKEVYPQASEPHKNAFRRLLEYSDPELQELLVYTGKHGDRSTLEVIESMRAHLKREIMKP